ncbi:unnamed protein product [Didymodactylos carnosus]|uniref:N-acetyltransferase domain-containing protein n=1 Tax=Didymodactylos carnosus TaxID=1234261 RepID=A0A814QAL5_9BILA|nr:unnamed protein product [Didymodactylos carnosus]CAF1302994.1 unnamed protein product [Didymodactylos carnosus]CAF3881164.1 unnamed protein product [Didymodactylos carnosus]CAF4109612.1 unnamed protein product [Didymodactylos carnosus]
MTQLVTPIVTIPIDQQVGETVLNWIPRPHQLDNPQCTILQGQYCRLELLNSKTNDTIIQQLYDAFKPTEHTHFTYLHYGPFQIVDEFKEFIRFKELPSCDTVFYSIIVNNIAVGFIGFLRINQDHGKIEIGHVNFSPQLLHIRSATEANYLLLQYAFDILCYRRVEWTCYSLNTKSRRPALRLGYQYEGISLKSEVCKGRSRDNAVYSIVDNEWILSKQEFQRWLSPENFDSHGQQSTKPNNAQINQRKKGNTDVV